MKLRVLFVEDEPGIAGTPQHALRTEGFEAAWVATGEAALIDARARPPALVILDVGLPDASGFEIFRQLRATSDVPVVFLTARSDEIDRVVGLELGADDYVAKPFSPRELVARVRGVLRRSARPADGGRPRRHGGLRLGCATARRRPLALARHLPRAARPVRRAHHGHVEGDAHLGDVRGRADPRHDLAGSRRDHRC